LAGPEQSLGVVYDGTVRSLSRLYQRHADSPFHDVKRNTRKTYADSLKVIEMTVGAGGHGRRREALVQAVALFGGRGR